MSRPPIDPFDDLVGALNLDADRAPGARLRLDLARDLLLSTIGATLLATAIDDAFLDGRGSSVLAALRATGPPSQSVSVRLAAVVAATVVAPSRPLAMQ